MPISEERQPEEGKGLVLPQQKAQNCCRPTSKSSI